ncbi:MAG TPA: hypothetical protein VH061_09365 [Solirubrobacteraceae bacterium]|jgi:hypothetical protein|nr:hypothetical protein [Solirubrobacteraceae bacterium]
MNRAERRTAQREKKKGSPPHRMPRTVRTAAGISGIEIVAPNAIAAIAAAGPLDLTDVGITGSETGLIVADTGDVRADGLRIVDAGTGIRNAGQFDGPDTVIE